MVKIALDAMGGDLAPVAEVGGAYLALKEYPVEITLVGPQEVIAKEVAKYKDWPKDRLKIHHASEVVGMSESPAVAFRKKKDSSIRVGINLVKEGVVDGFVSSGNTGSVMTTSILVLGKGDNIERPAIASVFPTKKGPVVVLDIGSNVDCKASYLKQFAMMGHYFSELIIGIENPKVGLLNIGEEEEKGNAVTQEAYQLLKKLPINFIGNIEGKDLLNGHADVVVCDGFVGNAILKFGESVTSVFYDFFKKEAKTSVLSLLGLLLLSPALKRFKKKFDYEEYGGADLLGVNGVSIVAHGRSNAKALKNAIRTAIHSVESDLVNKINGGLGSII